MLNTSNTDYDSVNICHKDDFLGGNHLQEEFYVLRENLLGYNLFYDLEGFTKGPKILECE